ncbi:hypothetical protein CDD83_304 [Cordyceps sp. RAO-2017]|nr:hypothetical protein CDD83_304 [Cordyceps sp. RAO-2017]
MATGSIRLDCLMLDRMISTVMNTMRDVTADQAGGANGDKDAVDGQAESDGTLAGGSAPGLAGPDMWMADVSAVELDNVPMEQPSGGSFATRTTFFVGFNVPEDKDMAGNHQMYVECFEPLSVVHQLSIILIHGDWHTGQIWATKPDGQPGWASHFNYKGYRVYVVDLPGFGRSNSLLPDQMQVQTPPPLPFNVERHLTATARPEYGGWDTAQMHDKWPGTGLQGDPVFDQYYNSLVPMLIRKKDRQMMGQKALGELLRRIGPSILIGQGTGATMAWLAADIEPDLVASVVAVEPTGPPGCSHLPRGGSGSQGCILHHHQLHNRVRQFGIADIPLTYDPPLEPDRGLDMMPVAPLGSDKGDQPCMLQHRAENGFPKGPMSVWRPRQLVNLKKMPHLVVTGQASRHSTFDWATVQFLLQTGLTVEHVKLQDFGLSGNGHLLFLEENSEQIATLVTNWARACHGVA